MSKFSLLALGLAFAANCFAQDVIITRDAKKYNAKVTEIGVFVVKYKLTSEENGPTYVLPKDKIAAITYENGRVETFFDGTTLSSDSATIASANTADSSALVFPPKDTLLPPPPPPARVVVVERPYAPIEDPAPEISEEEIQRHMFSENVKGLRFKLDVAPLFGATQYFYAFDDYRYYDYKYSRHHNHDDEFAYRDSSHSISPGLEGSFSVGYQFNPILYLGVGFDVQTLDKFDWLAFSGFLDLNVHCLRYSRTAPLFGMRVGISSLVEPEDQTGFFAEPYVGINHRFTPKLSLGAAVGYRASTFESNDGHHRYNGKYYDNTAYDAYFLKLFFMF